MFVNIFYQNWTRIGERCAIGELQRRVNFAVIGRLTSQNARRRVLFECATAEYRTFKMLTLNLTGFLSEMSNFVRFSALIATLEKSVWLLRRLLAMFKRRCTYYTMRIIGTVD
ncbi:hypothetical protein CBL_06899 [Carabus blaptoides fortunei]